MALVHVAILENLDKERSAAVERLPEAERQAAMLAAKTVVQEHKTVRPTKPSEARRALSFEGAGKKSSSSNADDDDDGDDDDDSLDDDDDEELTEELQLERELDDRLPQSHWLDAVDCIVRELLSSHVDDPDENSAKSATGESCPARKGSNVFSSPPPPFM